MRRWAAEGGPWFIAACVLLVSGLVVVGVGRSIGSTSTMGVGLALLLSAVVAIQLAVRGRNRRFETEMASMHDVIDQARSRRGEPVPGEDES